MLLQRRPDTVDTYFIFKSDFRMPWGTEPYVAFHFASCLPSFTVDTIQEFDSATCCWNLLAP